MKNINIGDRVISIQRTFEFSANPDIDDSIIDVGDIGTVTHIFAQDYHITFDKMPANNFIFKKSDFGKKIALYHESDMLSIIKKMRKLVD